MWGEQAREPTRKCELPFFVEEMEQRGSVDSRDAPVQLGECSDLGQRGRGSVEGSIDRRDRLEEDRVKGISRYERYREGLVCCLEQAMPKFPECCEPNEPRRAASDTL